jgi:hypothetical protein
MDRWDCMTRQLTGQPAPPLPAIPGRLHVLPPVTDDDPGLAEMLARDNEKEITK